MSSSLAMIAQLLLMQLWILLDGQYGIATPLILGEDYQFNCSFPNNCNSSSILLAIDGLLEGEKFNRISSNSFSPSQSNFTFSSVTIDDQGTLFQCICNDSYLSDILPLIIYFPPNYTVPELAPVFNGTYYNITLGLESLPYPHTHSWTHNGHPLSSVNHSTAHSLSFAPLSPSDNGTYAVTSRNIAGIGNASFELIVYYGPSFVEGSNVTKWVEFGEGTNVTLNCTVILPNPPKVSLNFFNHSSHTDNIQLTSTNHTGQYTITDAVIENEGKYSCQAVGTHCTTTLTYWVFIGGPPIASVIANASVTDDQLVVDCSLTDNSSAPVTGLLLSLTPDGPSHTVELATPVISSNELIKGAVSIPLDTLPLLQYTLLVDVYNQLATVSAVYSTVITLSSHSLAVSSTSVHSQSTTSSTHSPTSTSTVSSSSSSTATVSSSTISSSISTSSNQSSSTSLIHSSSSTTPQPNPSVGGDNGAVIALAIIIPLILIVGGAAITVAILCIWKRRSSSKRRSAPVSQYEPIIDVGGYESFMASLDDDPDEDLN